jgi:hypothetical protein
MRTAQSSAYTERVNGRNKKTGPTVGECLFALVMLALLVVAIAGLWAMAFDDPLPYTQDLPGVKGASTT